MYAPVYICSSYAIMDTIIQPTCVNLVLRITNFSWYTAVSSTVMRSIRLLLLERHLKSTLLHYVISGVSNVFIFSFRYLLTGDWMDWSKLNSSSVLNKYVLTSEQNLSIYMFSSWTQISSGLHLRCSPILKPIIVYTQITVSFSVSVCVLHLFDIFCCFMFDRCPRSLLLIWTI